MAHLRCDFRSEVLDMNTSMTVILPEAPTLGKMGDVRVVYLLHGLADNCSGWSRYTSVERYARKYNLALVIPEVQRSFYFDMVYGLKYFTFVHDELRNICEGFFGFSDERNHNYIMGLSMGGYGSLKCAFTTPLHYAGVAAFSAVTDISAMVDGVKEIGTDGLRTKDCNRREFRAIFGPDCSLNDADDLFKLVARSDAQDLPALFLACGENDSLFEQSRDLYQTLASKGADVAFEHWSGAHDWDFWDKAVCRAFDYFFGEKG